MPGAIVRRAGQHRGSTGGCDVTGVAATRTKGSE